MENKLEVCIYEISINNPFDNRSNGYIYQIFIPSTSTLIFNSYNGTNFNDDEENILLASSVYNTNINSFIFNNNHTASIKNRKILQIPEESLNSLIESIEELNKIKKQVEVLALDIIHYQDPESRYISINYQYISCCENKCALHCSKLNNTLINQIYILTLDDYDFDLISQKNIHVECSKSHLKLLNFNIIINPKKGIHYEPFEKLLINQGKPFSLFN